MTVAPKKWIVGLDLRPRSQGAMRWAAWLSRGSATKSEHIIGIHVLEEDHMRVALRYHQLPEMVESAGELIEETMSSLGIRDAFREVHVQQGGSAEETLGVAAAYHHADVLVLGRQALRESHRIHRLGRVARRILRSLPVPTVIVPPDLEPPEDPTAPIMVGCNLDDDSLGGLRFAADMATRLGRPLIVVHAIAMPEDYGARILSDTVLEDLRRDNQREGEAELARWVAARGIEATCVVHLGDTVHGLVGLAEKHHAALLVTGSRRLSTLERVFLTSTGSETAASAACAVAVVPPTEAS